MAIGIGLHCWYCDHGPCNGECNKKPPPLYTETVYDKIKKERDHQDAKWGPQDHPSIKNGMISNFISSYYGILTEDEAKLACDAAFKDGHGTWSHILIEELSEAIHAKTEEKRKEELIQVAAVAIAWIESIERNEKNRI
jgi:hypothetical protein